MPGAVPPGPVLARALQAGVRARPVPRRAARDTAEQGQVDSGVSELSALQDLGPWCERVEAIMQKHLLS